MAKNLVIVESPAKAKTIQKILGKDFAVKSSFGHIRDLDKGSGAVNVDKQFKPKYVVTPDKRKVVKELKSAVKNAEVVWLATDEDREGEAISWHLCHVLGLKKEQTHRIVFREITKPAIEQAIKHPRHVDENLVNAQQARRILDRLVGYELSELLWRKVKGKLSAGRVQSVAVKLIVEKEREIQNFQSEASFKIRAIFDIQDEKGRSVKLQADLDHDFDTVDEALQFLNDCKGAEYSIQDIKVKPGKRSPAAPFTTSTLQQDASRKLYFPVKKTMRVAQKLYEAGYISYMRTDSTNLSEVAIKNIATEVEKQYGGEYVKSRRYKTKKNLAQEAHEAIRPTYIERKNIEGSRDMVRLYDLIWRRTIASQMADARLERTEVTIDISTRDDVKLKARGEVLKFDGFLKVYLESKDDDDDEESKDILPPLKVGIKLDPETISATERFTRPPARYSEAGLVKKLEEMGIGRPSTYAPTISKIMESDRGYVTKESRPGQEREYRVLTLRDEKIEEKKETENHGATKNRLYPTDLGMVVSDFLLDHFQEIMDYGFTAEIEEKFDIIAEGRLEWTQMLEDFYGPFHQDVEETMATAKRSKGERVLGTDPETGNSVVAKISRFGQPMIQIGTFEELEEEEKPRFANLRNDQSIDNIELDEALKLFVLPRNLGQYKGLDVEANTGRYGPYIKYGENYVNMPRGEDPFEITFERAVELIEAKKKMDQPIGTYKSLPYTKGKGRYGPFLKWNGMYVNIPKKIDPETITTEEAIELIRKKEEKEANRYILRWEDKELAVENGRWGPFIRYKRKSFKIPKKDDGEKYSTEEIKEWSVEDVERIIEEQAPGTIKKNKTKKK